MVHLQNLGATLVLVLVTIRIGSVVTQATYGCHYCVGSSNDTADTNYQNNLATLLDSLSLEAANNSFSNSSLNGIFGLYQCRGDVTGQLCQNCVQNASLEVQNRCPSNKTAIIWYNQCMVIFNNSNFFGLEQTFPTAPFLNSNINTSPNGTEVVFAFMSTLVSKVPHSDMMFSVDVLSVGGSQPVYGLAQCRRDMSSGACSDCLGKMIGSIEQCCQGRTGWQILAPSCYLRYEEYLFFAQQLVPPSMPPSTAPPQLLPPSKGKNHNTSRRIIIIAVSTIIPVMAFIVCICIILRKTNTKLKLKVNAEAFEAGDQISIVETLQYDFKTISIASDNFSDSNKLGQGGFGAVYKGKLLNGQEIAVKRLAKESRQGEIEFKNEVRLLAKLNHRNLVRLLGFCLEGIERLLIYEFVPRSSLDHLIFNPNKCKLLDWDRRYKIIEGVSRGLLYLHDYSRRKIIHRDLKAGNILLDEDMNPKIADFGMARLFVVDETQERTNRIVGTYGYMAPEYAMHGQFSVKSDVFSFGVLVLEILSGQKTNTFCNGENDEDLLSYAWKTWREGTPSNLIDPILKSNSGLMQEMIKCIHIGLLCVQENAKDRPTMASVVFMLSSSSFCLPVPSEPASFLHNARSNADLPLRKEPSHSKNEVSIT